MGVLHNKNERSLNYKNADAICSISLFWDFKLMEIVKENGLQIKQQGLKSGCRRGDLQLLLLLLCCMVSQFHLR
jgi:hypothetical protein